MSAVVDRMSFRVSPLTEAFFQTAKSRRDAVDMARKLYRMPDGSEIPKAVAVEMVEAYYRDHGGKPWLRRARTAT